MGGLCRVSCASNADCVNASCVNGLCTRSLVAPCSQDQECATGFCADGVCCNVACRGPCVSCLLPGSLGTCAPVPAGAPDTRALCVDQGVATCGANGRCDGFGACQRYAVGATCSAPKCVGDQLTLPGNCTADGQCVAPITSCAPFTCRTDAPMCHSGCPSGDAICAPGAYCSGDEVCMPKKGIGAPCATDHECVSNHCTGPAPGGGPSICLAAGA
jgi:hypothetical protein